MGLIILYFLGALSLSFLCSVLEAVLLSTPMSFISMKETSGNKTATLMKQYKNNVDRPVGAILWLSGNLVGISINLCKSIQKELFINDTP